MRRNRTRKLLSEGKAAFSISQSYIGRPEVTRLLARAGLDWVFIDSEHGPFSSDTLQELVRTALQTDITPIVRVGDFQYDLVARALDAGAEGIILPRVESPDVLREALSWAKFPPLGVRGYGLAPAHLGYEAHPLDKVTEHMNREILVIAQIESTTAMAKLDELASVEGLDCLLVGPADLSISLGIAGQWDNPQLLAAISQVVEACKRHGKWPGIQVRNLEFAQVCLDLGMKLIGCSTEIQTLWEGISGLASDLRATQE